MSRRDAITFNLYSAVVVGAVVAGMFALSACSEELPKEVKVDASETPIPDIIRYKDRPRQTMTSAVVVDKETGCEYIATYSSYGGPNLTIRYGENGTIMCPTHVIVQPDGTEVPA